MKKETTNKMEAMLDFHQVREKLKEYAYTQAGKNKIKELEPYLDERTLRGNLRETSEARIIIEQAGNPPFTSLEGMKESLESAMRGEVLTGEQLEHIEAVLVSIQRLKDYLSRLKHLPMGLPFYEENLSSLEQLRSEIHQIIREGKVDDFATKLLRDIRNKIQLKETKMREKADQILRANKKMMSDNYTTQRNGRLCVPVKKEDKNRIKGAIIDQSFTGSTVFIEPTGVGKLYDELSLLKMEEENEVRRILYSLTNQVAEEEAIFMENQRLVEKLDFIFAKGKLSVDLNGVEPTINTQRKILLQQARHPLMDQKTVVPLEFEIGDTNKGVIITGPNTGGKTVAIKTVALNCMMAQSGLHVCAKKADICMNNGFFCDIGDGQNISENLSTFSSHITNVLSILNRANQDSLVILDELGSGTDPTEGMGIAIAILEELMKTGALFLVTTHYPEVKNYGNNRTGVVNARMTFDQNTLLPTYQLVLGEAGESCAFSIARKLGMPEHMLKRAQEESYGESCSPSLSLSTQKINQSNEGQLQERPKKIEKIRENSNKQDRALQFELGESVMVFPDKKIGIVCEKANEKGVLRIQMQDKKIYINHKRIKSYIKPEELYPDDYDFSIIFDSVQKRKLSHKMDRKYVKDEMIEE